MQRLLIRLSAVGTVLVLGVLAIAQTQFKTTKGDAVASQQGKPRAEASPGDTQPKIPQPIPGMAEDEPAEPPLPPSSGFRAVEPDNQRFEAAPPTYAVTDESYEGESSDALEPGPPAFDGGGTYDPPGRYDPGGTYAGDGSIRTVAGESPAQPAAAPPAFAAQDMEQHSAEDGLSDQGAAASLQYGGSFQPLPSDDVPAAPVSEPLDAGGVAEVTNQPGIPGRGSAGAATRFAFSSEGTAATTAPSDAPKDSHESHAAEEAPGFAGEPPAGEPNGAPADIPPDPAAGGGFASPAPESFSMSDSPAPPPAGDAAAIAVVQSAEEAAPPASADSTPTVPPGSFEGDSLNAETPNGQPPSAGYGAASDYGPPPVEEGETGNADNAGTAAARSSAGGTGLPGDRRLEGAQTPTLTIEKLAPREIQVNRSATFQLRVRNVGSTPAHQVIVLDEVPRGTRLLKAAPDFARSPDGALTWQLGTLAPGQDVTITMELLPLEEGEIGSVAQVSFQAEASVRTTCTQPRLTLKHTAAPKVLIGDQVVLSIALSNQGSGAATGVVIEEDVPEGLSHAAGRALEYEVGTLRPGETRNLELPLQAAQAGKVRNRLVVRADGDILVEDQITIEVTAPQMKLALEGPKRRYLEQQATYQIAVANEGTAAAQELEMTAILPPGFQFVSTNNQGQYDPQEHVVRWSLAELPAGVQGAVELTVLPVKAGTQKLRVTGTAAMDLSAGDQLDVGVEGVAALSFQVRDVVDPIPVGNVSVYEVRISNTGSKESANVRLTASLPTGMQPLSGDGPTQVKVQGSQLLADPLANLAPGADAVYKLRARGTVPGDQRIRIELQSDELTTPILKEESTRVYADR